jgi:hypothetical protein
MARILIEGRISQHGGRGYHPSVRANTPAQFHVYQYDYVVFETNDGDTIQVTPLNVRASVDPVVSTGAHGKFLISKSMCVKQLVAAEVDGTYFGHVSKATRARYGFTTAKVKKI